MADDEAEDATPDYGDEAVPADVDEGGDGGADGRAEMGGEEAEEMEEVRLPASTRWMA
jgi:hypothetical protein